MKDIIRKLKEQKFITKVDVSEEDYKDDITQTGDPDEIIKYVESKYEPERPEYPITKESNSALMSIMHVSGLAASEDFMTWDEVEAVTDESIQKSSIMVGSSPLYVSFFDASYGINGAPECTFDEFKYFTNVQDLTNVWLPMNVISVTLPKSINNVSSIIASRNNKLKKIDIDSENPNFIVENNCIIELSTSKLWFCCADNIVIPDTITSISESAFSYSKNLVSIELPHNINDISDQMFYMCTSLTSITIPDSVTSIGERAFDNCTSLASITIPDSVTSIGKQVFNKCTNLSNVKLSNNITNLPEYTFQNCASLKTVIIPDSVTEIIGGVFWDSGLETITIPANVVSMSAAFLNCRKLSTIISLAQVAGKLNGSYGNTSNMGADVEGEKILQVPKDATGYDSYPWSAFGYTLKYME